MENIKFIILFSFVLTGAWLVHQATLDVQQMKDRELKLKSMHDMVKERDIHFMKRATDIGRTGHHHHDGLSFGSIVVKQGEIIGEGVDRTRLLNDPSAHAEMEAIREACKYLSSQTLNGASIYTTVQPCPMCLSLIYLAGIDTIYYGLPDQKLTPFASPLSAEDIYKAIGTEQLDRPVPEIRVVQSGVGKTIADYKTH